MAGMRFRFFCLLAFVVAYVGAYKSVVMMHGYGGSASDFTQFNQFIQKYHPGTPTVMLNLFNNEQSFAPMWTQADGIILALSKINLTDEYILIGHSQGALLCRSVLEMMTDHRVSKFISLAGPQMGQYGIVGDWPNPWNLTTELIYEVFYTPVLQALFSAANYWNDPFHHKDYLSDVVYLPIINNQTSHPSSKLFKENFLRTKSMYFFGSPADGTIQPWQSTQWGFWADNKDNEIIPMENQPVYVNDYFGLKTLHQQGRLFVTSVPGVIHDHWVLDENIFVEHLLPLLD